MGVYRRGGGVSQWTTGWEWGGLYSGLHEEMVVNIVVLMREG